MLATVVMRRIAVLLGVAVAVAPRSASAANENKPRVPVTWTEQGCATIVDRSTTPVVNLPYSVMAEETEPLTDDETEDSRRQQFFAFARLDYAAVASPTRLPIWITQADIDRAELVDPLVQDMVAKGQIGPDDILETTSRFAASDWLRITADDARVPITFEQAAMGVDWDVSAVPPGAYTVWGYTWEPILNLWAPHSGFVKVIASAAEADDAGPGVALLYEEVQVEIGEPHPVPGCVDAPAGSTLTLEWGEVVSDLEPDWQPLFEDEPIESGMLDVEMVLPSAAREASLVRLRATVTDPAGNAYVAYTPGTYAVLGGGGDSDGNSGGDDDGGDGCGCTSTPRDRSTVGWLALVGLALLRRRRSP